MTKFLIHVLLILICFLIQNHNLILLFLVELPSNIIVECRKTFSHVRTYLHYHLLKENVIFGVLKCWLFYQHLQHLPIGISIHWRHRE